jgi:hypothetical protein
MNKISQLLTAPEGYACTGLEGEVSKIYKRSVFSNAKGDNSVQKVIIQDASGSSIRCAFWGRDEFPYGEGTKILITPTSQGKGLTIKDNEYQGKTTKELNVGDKCGIVQIDEYSDQTETESSNAITTAENTSSSNASMLPVPLVQNINLIDLCIQGATTLRTKYPNMTDDQFQAITSSLFIECNRQNVGKSMPSQLL